ncbi:hypothetical protein ACFONG_00525 [Uliginosibacterium paludis]|uniref:Uncharacterized protein n=1 Tax=Uliginosibacterium paludis TaxID=1615952 RepID=A0ABV2CR60_9RHOO
MLIEREMSDFSWSCAADESPSLPELARAGHAAASAMAAARLATREETAAPRRSIPLIPPNFSLR